MKIAFLHYHLKTGGVTTVLRGQITAIRGVCDTLVLTGNRAGTIWPCEVAEIPEIGYDRPGNSPPAPQAVADRILTAISKAWPQGCDVLHVHNPTLAKNRCLLRVLNRLQLSGISLFLQIHDFAEDGRPNAYFREPYPADCHYGVINSRDCQILLRAGLDPGGVHLVPNAIQPLPVERRRPEPLVLYPIRAIRRKNLGEAILLSLFLRNAQRLDVSQPPNSPQDIASYRAWKRFVKEKRLNVNFEVGRKVDFSALVGAAASMVTTSIAEGFGFSFLEPWTAGLLLWGRKLGEVCRDFEQNGVRLDHLYDRLAVPFDWFDTDAFFQRWRTAAFAAADAYDHPLAPEAVDRNLAAMARGKMVDFGNLDETSQRQTLSRLLADGAARANLITLNPWMEHPGIVSDSEDIIANNRKAVADRYSPALYRERLLTIYDRVARHPVRHRIDKRVLLDAFFDLERFPLLKWSAYDG
ncbi:MAG: hypothetical protein NWQ21_09995 [Desulfobacterales bacterium]|nr:hypothetical protein [Desulfobacterales bacterium]